MKTPLFQLLTGLFLATTIEGSSRTSEHYAIVAETIDYGGQLVASISPDYSIQGSIASVTGISEDTGNPNTITRHGYIGQLYEVTGLLLSASPTTVNEGGTLPLSASLFLDDATTLAVPATSVAWSVVAGPLTSIDAAGLATAGPAYQNTAATAQGIHLGFTATLGLTVADTLPDNFGSYAGDGLADSWQFQYFGLDNPLAAPTQDPDGDGQDNRFEHTAGIIPNDPLSRFLLRIEQVPGQADWKDLIFSPLVAGRTYEVKSTTALTGAWQTLGTFTTTDAGDQRTVTDHDAAGTAKFYHVEITNP